MRVEEALRDAMSAHVGNVHAAPGSGAAVRRRHSRHVLRLRAASVALAIVAAGGVVPVYTLVSAVSASGPMTAETGSGDPGETRPRAANVVPDVKGLKVADAMRAVENTGFKVKFRAAASKKGATWSIVRQDPAAGATLAPGSPVTLTFVRPAITRSKARESTDRPKKGVQSDLGDLGDGRAFGRIRVGYLPSGLEWSGWSSSGSGWSSSDFDKYTTTWDDNNKYDLYCVQIYAYEAEAIPESEARRDLYIAQGRGREVAIGYRSGLLVNQWVWGDESGTPSLYFAPASDLRVEVMISPNYVKKLGGAQRAEQELVKIALGIRATTR